MTLLKKGLALSANSYAQVALGVLQMVVLSRALGPQGVGDLALFRQTFLICVQAASLGLPLAMVSFVGSGDVSRSNAVRSVLVACGCIGAAAGLTVAGLLAIPAPPVFGATHRTIAVAAAIWIPTVVMRAVLYSDLLGQMRVRAMMAVETLPSLILCVCYVIAWQAGFMSLPTAVLSEALVGGAISLGIAVWLTKAQSSIARAPGEPLIDISFIRRAIPTGIEMSSSTLLVLLNGYVALSVLKLVNSDALQVGYYSRGLSISTQLVIALQSIQRLLYANWSGMEARRRAESVERTVNFTVIVVLLAAVPTMLLAQPLVVALAGAEFAPAVPVLRVTMIGVGVFAVVRVLMSLFNADRASRYNLIILSAGVLVHGAAAMALAPRFGAQGSSWALVAGYAAMLATSLWIGIARFSLRPSRMLVPSPGLFASALRGVRRKPALQ